MSVRATCFSHFCMATTYDFSPHTIQMDHKKGTLVLPFHYSNNDLFKQDGCLDKKENVQGLLLFCHSNKVSVKPQHVRNYSSDTKLKFITDVLKHGWQRCCKST